jgi:ATP-dependent protease HslVU (ClpYQ) peptidase subunit
MTCIAGIVTSDGRIVMGGDGRVGSSAQRRLVRPKVVTKGDLVIGTSGTLGALDAIDTMLVLPVRDPGVSDFGYLMQELVPSIKGMLRKQGTLKVNEGVETWEDRALVGYRGHLYCIWTTFGVSESMDGFDAVGSGEDYALGALKVMDEPRAAVVDVEDAKARILKALTAAAHFDPFVGEPFTILVHPELPPAVTK